MGGRDKCRGRNALQGEQKGSDNRSPTHQVECTVDSGRQAGIDCAGNRWSPCLAVRRAGPFRGWRGWREAGHGGDGGARDHTPVPPNGYLIIPPTASGLGMWLHGLLSCPSFSQNRGVVLRVGAEGSNAACGCEDTVRDLLRIYF